MDFSLKLLQTESPRPLDFNLTMPLTISTSIAVFAAPIALISLGHLDDGLKQICTLIGSDCTAPEHFFCPSMEEEDDEPSPQTSRGCGIGGYNATYRNAGDNASTRSMVHGIPKTDFIAVAEPGTGIVGLLFERNHSDNVSKAFITERCANIGFVTNGDAEDGAFAAVTMDEFIGATPSTIDTISRKANLGIVVQPGFKKCVFII